MFGIHDLWLFVVSGLLLNITPGPDVLYIVGRSSTQGARAGAVAALGIGSGTLVHILAASLGLSAILATSATAFTVVKMIGAAYLVYVGISLIRSTRSRGRPKDGDDAGGSGTDGRGDVAGSRVASPGFVPVSLRNVFLQGFLTNVLNPKVALFFLAFLPQFVGDAPSKPLALLFLGVVFDVNGTLWNLLVAWSTARMATRLTGGARFMTWFNRSVGTLFVAVGIKLALSAEH